MVHYVADNNVMTNSNQLPKYNNPPVIEVVVSVQFEAIKELQVTHLGLLWGHFRDKFPSVSHHQPIPNVIERFGVKPSSPENNKLEFDPELPFPRCWYAESSDGGGLIQVQQDRFVRNWRKKKDTSDTYPTFNKYVMPSFLEDYGTFSAFLDSQKISPASPNQVEITYINHIKKCDVWEKHNQLANVFNFLHWNFPANHSNELENVTISMRHIIRDASGEFLGRLHVSISPVYLREDREPAFLLQLVARGRPLDQKDGIQEFLKIGHAKIVNTFTDITTEQMHKVWERTR